jgi:hypothetical protein
MTMRDYDVYDRLTQDYLGTIRAFSRRQARQSAAARWGVSVEVEER